MENEIMNDVEVVNEVIDETTPAGSGKGLIAVAVAGAVLLGGRLLYKKVIKPAIAKAKAKKEAQQEIEADYEEPTVEVTGSDEI